LYLDDTRNCKHDAKDSRWIINHWHRWNLLLVNLCIILSVWSILHLPFSIYSFIYSPLKWFYEIIVSWLLRCNYFKFYTSQMDYFFISYLHNDLSFAFVLLTFSFSRERSSTFSYSELVQYRAYGSTCPFVYCLSCLFVWLQLNFVFLTLLHQLPCFLLNIIW